MSEIKIDWWKTYVIGKDVPSVPEDLLSDDFEEICEWAEKIALAAERERIQGLVLPALDAVCQAIEENTPRYHWEDDWNLDAYTEFITLTMRDVRKVFDAQEAMNTINQEGA